MQVDDAEDVTAPEAEAPAKPDKAPRKPRKAKAEGAPKAAKAATTKPRKAAVPKDQFGLRAGSTKSKAAAMYASDEGATLEEVKTALGSIQLNLLKELEGKGHTVKRTKENGDGKRQVTRYFLSI